MSFYDIAMGAGGLKVTWLPKFRVIASVWWVDMVYAVRDKRATLVNVKLAYLISRLR
jgi:hypothetical protein